MVDVYATIGAGCDITYKIHNVDDVEFTFGTEQDGCTLTIEGTALRSLMNTAERALADLARAEREYVASRVG